MIINNTESPKLYNQYILKKYNDKFYKLILFKFGIDTPGYEKEKNPNQTYDEKLDNSISRTRSKIFEYAMCNEFDYFITLTLNKEKHDRYDLEGYIKKLGQWIRDERKRTGKRIEYLLIPEKHKDGAYHMHGLIKGLEQADLRLFTEKDNIPDKIKNLIRHGRKIHNWIPYSERFGWVTLEQIRNTEFVSKYITKYIKKDIGNAVIELNKKSYYVTRGLKTSEVMKKGTFPALTENVPTFNFENDYLKILETNNTKIFEILGIL